MMSNLNSRKSSAVVSVTRPSSLSNQLDAEESSFYWGLRLMCIVNRLFGLSFVTNLGSVRTVTFSYRTSWHTILYAMCLWSFGTLFLAVEVMVVKEFFYSVSGSESSYTDCIRIAYNIGIAVYMFQCLVLRGFFTVPHGSAIIVFVKATNALERALIFNEKLARRLKIMAVVCSFSQILIAFQVIVEVVFFNLGDKMLGYPVYNTTIDKEYVVLMKLGLVACAPSVLMTEVWVVYFCVFFAFSFQTIIDRLKSSTDVTTVDALHKLFLKTADGVNNLKDIHSLSIFISFSTNFVLCCFTVCLIAMENSVGRRSTDYFVTFLGCFSRVVVPTLFAGYMEQKVQEVHSVLQRGLITKRSYEEEEAVLNFRQSVDSSKVQLTGANFFKVNNAMIVGMVSSIITFAVILIQGMKK